MGTEKNEDNSYGLWMIYKDLWDKWKHYSTQSTRYKELADEAWEKVKVLQHHMQDTNKKEPKDNAER